MIECRRRLPAVHIVAFKAIGRRLPPMFVRMAPFARSRQPEKSSIRVARFRIQRFLIGYVFSIMAFAAFQTFMLSDQAEFGL